jgi:radical SAM protein with 4Fe4S-binding SPASM domain
MNLSKNSKVPVLKAFRVFNKLAGKKGIEGIIKKQQIKKMRKSYNSSRDLSGKPFDSFCYAPFGSLFFNPLGNVVACCRSSAFILGNVKNESISQIWNGGKIRDLRRALSSYNLPPACEFCRWQVEKGDFTNVSAKSFDMLKVKDLDNIKPVQMEFALSNICNLECIMCHGDFSALIRARRDKLPALPMVYPDQFFTELREYLPHLTRAKFYGGEPFLITEYYRIWEMMIEDGINPELEIIINTNGSIYNSKSIRILNNLPIHLIISLDGITQKTVESIRVNSDYNSTMKNISQFYAYTKERKTSLVFAVCLMQQNWHELGDLLLFAEEMRCKVFINKIIDPSYCSLFSLKSGELRKIVDKMHKQGEWLLDKLDINRQAWLDAVDDLDKYAASKDIGRVQRLRDTPGYYERKESAETILDAAGCLVEDGKLHEALEETLRVAESSPLYYFSLVTASHIRRCLGEYEEAERDLKKAISLLENRSDAFMARAWLRFEEGRFKDAIQDAVHARELEPDSEVEAYACEVLGLSWSRMENFEQALEASNRVIELRPQDAAARIQRGRAFYRLGLIEEAKTDVAAALEIDPINQEAELLKIKLSRK